MINAAEARPGLGLNDGPRTTLKEHRDQPGVSCGHAQGWLPASPSIVSPIDACARLGQETYDSTEPERPARSGLSAG